MRQMLQTNPPYLHNSAVCSLLSGVLRCSIVAPETRSAISGAGGCTANGGGWGCCPGFPARAASLFLANPPISLQALSMS